ncbi:hypothetical protein VTK26DRAFT_6843 [Humicola hyalothermophila]
MSKLRGLGGPTAASAEPPDSRRVAVASRVHTTPSPWLQVIYILTFRDDGRTANESLGAFVTTIFLLGYTCGPIVIAPFSEMYGRAINYKVCMALFTVFNMACAVANSLGSLIVFRFLAGIAGSCPITLGTGSIADLVRREKRAGAMAAYTIGTMLGPSVAPIFGGYMAQTLGAVGWRWTSGVTAIASGGLTVVAVCFVRETYPYVLLQRKTERLRKQTGNPDLRSALDSGKASRELFAFSILRPLRMFLSPIVFLLSLYVAIVYGYLYLAFTTFPRVFGQQYGFNSGPSGLAALGIGIGAVVGTMFSAMSDKLSSHLTKKNGGVPQPEYRLPIMAVGGFLVPIGLFWYGWTAEYKTHWFAPIVGSGFIGAGMIVTYMASTMYLVDAFTVYSASVTASSTILRSLLGALLPLAGGAMYDALGIGWGTSVLGFIAVAFIPLPFVFYFYGQRIREFRLFEVEF